MPGLALANRERRVYNMPNDYKACLVSNLTDYSRGDELL